MLSQDTKDKLFDQKEQFSKSDLTSRERVRYAIRHQETDRLPFDLWAAPLLWENLREAFSVPDDEAVMELFSIDMRLVLPDYIGPAPIEIDENVFINQFGSYRTTRKTPFGEYYELVRYPLAQASTVDEILNYQFLPKKEHWNPNSVKAIIEKLDRNHQTYMRYESCGIFEYAWPLFGLENFLLRMAMDDMTLPNALMEYITEMFIDLTLEILQAAEGRIDMVYIYDDIGTQTSLMMSVPMWKKYILPWHQKYLKVIRDAFDVDIMYHTDGAIYPFIQPLVEDLGIDVLNPMQPKAAGMDFSRIKSEFGDRLAFHGGIDVQDILPNDSPQQVTEEVTRVKNILGQNGGYICAPAHKMQADVPVENVVALFTAPRALS